MTSSSVCDLLLLTLHTHFPDHSLSHGLSGSSKFCFSHFRALDKQACWKTTDPLIRHPHPLLCMPPSRNFRALSIVAYKRILMHSCPSCGPGLLSNCYACIFSIVRWIAAAVLFLLYSFRVWYWAGWYVVSYGLGIYLLNILVDFLSPLQDPDASDEAELPTSNNDEYRPFIRKLPEFTTWYRATRALSIALFLAMWQVFNIPVFWPILLIYFIMLFMGTMRQRLQHMIRHKYLPFSFGKPKFSKSTTI